MKVSATELMKRLKAIREEINYVHANDREKSYVQIEKDANGHLVPAYEATYEFANNRARIKELQEEERRIKKVLAEFNLKTKVDKDGLTVAEALVIIGQMHEEIRILQELSRKGKWNTDYRNTISKALYDQEELRETLKEMQSRYSKLQVAVDKTNLNSEIEF